MDRAKSFFGSGRTLMAVMNRLFFAVFFLLMPMLLFSEVSLKTVRIFIGEELLEWNRDGRRPDSMYWSFIDLQPGSVYSQETLARLCRESEYRLQKSGYVYDASIIIVPPKEMSQDRTVVVTLSPGFMLRFGGGNAWGMFGVEGLGGNRMAVRLYAGANRNGVSFRSDHTANTPLVAGGSLFWYGPIQAKDKELNRAEGALLLGYAVKPDLILACDFAVATDAHSFIDKRSTSPLMYSLQPHFTWTKYFSPSGNRLTRYPDSTGEVRTFWYPVSGAVKTENRVAFHLVPHSKSIVALRYSFGISSKNIPDTERFDLYYRDDLNVRSGYSASELQADSYMLGSLEFRQTIVDFTIPPAFNGSLNTFVFCDFAVTSNTSKALDAYGLGARLLFDNPVFSYFSFSWGLNRTGESRFIFSGTAGF